MIISGIGIYKPERERLSERLALVKTEIRDAAAYEKIFFRKVLTARPIGAILCSRSGNGPGRKTKEIQNENCHTQGQR